MDLGWFGIVGWFFTFFGLLGNSWVIFKKKKITDNNKLVHPFLGGGRSGCYLCESSGIHDLQCACGYMQQTRSSDIRWLLHRSFYHLLDRHDCWTLYRYRSFIQICPFPDVLQDSRYHCELLDNSISFRHLPNYHPSWQQRAFRRRHV